MVLERRAIEDPRGARGVLEDQPVADRGRVAVNELHRDSRRHPTPDQVEARRQTERTDVAGVGGRARIADRRAEEREGDPVVHPALEVAVGLEIEVVDDVGVVIAEAGREIRPGPHKQARAELGVAVTLVLGPRARFDGARAEGHHRDRESRVGEKPRDTNRGWEHARPTSVAAVGPRRGSRSTG